MSNEQENVIVLAFDLYGTLLSTQSIADKLFAHFGAEKAATIATTWRRYQLEYTWRSNSMNQYESFSALTRRSLHHALAESAVSLNASDTETMIRAYDRLSCFPDVPPTLAKLRRALPEDLRAVISSNGTLDMVSKSVDNSPELSADVFTDIVSVEDVKKFKPAPEVYHHLAKKMGKEEQLDNLWLVSGNPFDIVGARAAGLQAIWVDRAGNGWQDCLTEGERGMPTAIVRSLEEVVDIARGAGSTK